MHQMSSRTVPLSVIVPVKNEERNIVACLESVSFASEIWVVDSHSSDRTVELSRRFTEKVVQFDYSGSYPRKKNWALENLPFSHEWVLIIDADERVPSELAREIASAILSNGATDGYYVNRKLIFLGRWI